MIGVACVPGASPVLLLCVVWITVCISVSRHHRCGTLGADYSFAFPCWHGSWFFNQCAECILRLHWTEVVMWCCSGRRVFILPPINWEQELRRESVCVGESINAIIISRWFHNYWPNRPYNASKEWVNWPMAFEKGPLLGMLASGGRSILEV